MHNKFSQVPNVYWIQNWTHGLDLFSSHLFSHKSNKIFSFSFFWIWKEFCVSTEQFNGPGVFSTAFLGWSGEVADVSKKTFNITTGLAHDLDKGKLDSDKFHSWQNSGWFNLTKRSWLSWVILIYFMLFKSEVLIIEK